MQIQIKVVNADIGPELNSFRILNPRFMFHQPNVKLQALNLGCAFRIFFMVSIMPRMAEGRWVDISRCITTYLLAQRNTRTCTADIFTVLIKVVMETIINCSLQKSQKQTATTMSNDNIRLVLPHPPRPLATLLNYHRDCILLIHPLQKYFEYNFFTNNVH